MTEYDRGRADERARIVREIEELREYEGIRAQRIIDACIYVVTRHSTD